MNTTFPGGSHLDDLYAVFRALRMSSNILHEYLGQWLAMHLYFAAPEVLPAAKQSLVLWSALGLKEDKHQKVAHEWQLTWDDDKLFISSHCMNDNSLLEQLSDFFLSILSLERFSSSRWLTIGRSCRSLSLCRLCGLDS